MSEKIAINPFWFRSQREIAGLSIEQVAQLCDLEPFVIAGMEKGYRTLTRAQAMHVSEVLNHALIDRAKRPSLPAPESTQALCLDRANTETDLPVTQTDRTNVPGADRGGLF